jgi:hypothetical protein
MMAGESNPDTPAQATVKEDFRRTFNQKMFGIIDEVAGQSSTDGVTGSGTGSGLVMSPTKLTKSSQMTQQRWNGIVEMIEQWGSTDNPNKAFRKANRRGYEITKKYHLLQSIQFDARGSEVRTTALPRILKHTKTDTIAVPQLGVFDAIYDIHNKIRHLKSKKDTRRRIKLSYYNVTDAQVDKFMDLCPVCVRNKEKTKDDANGDAEFRDRFQVSLIDFTKKAMKDIYGRTMRWLMVMMDHGTRLVYIRCIPMKLSRYVAFELNQIFGLTGYPDILHIQTGNSREFTAQVILDLKTMNSSIITVAHGDQGHVQMNITQLVKRLTANLEETERQKGNTPNWTMMQGHVMSVVNSQSGKGKKSFSAYEKVYGMRFNPLIHCSLEELRKCETIEQRLLLAPDPRLDKVAREICKLDDDELDNEYSSAEQATTTGSKEAVLFDAKDEEGEGEFVDAEEGEDSYWESTLDIAHVETPKKKRKKA